MSHVSPSFVSSRSFTRALGRIGAALPAFDEAMRHAAFHALQGQVTPLNRLYDAAKVGGHLRGDSWRLCLETLRPALVGFVIERTGPVWEAKEIKAGRKVCTSAEAEAKAAALAPLADVIEAAQAAKEAKAAGAKEAKAEAKAKAAEAEAAKVAEAKARGLSFDAEAEALTVKLCALASADLSSIAKRAEEVKAAEAKGLTGDTVAPASLRLVSMLAGMPGALVTLAEALAAAGVLAQSTGAAAEAAKTAEALESFGVAKAKAAEEAAAARVTRAKAAEECAKAKAEAEALTAEALALAEEAAATRATAKAKAEEAGAAKVAELLAAGAVKVKRSRVAPALAS